tara:strand:- start:231 stop:1178 length:948 start_codon:yes stop_codon:yes gene_type:complete
LEYKKIKKNILSKWEQSISDSIFLTPFDLISWKKIWIDNYGKDFQDSFYFGDNYFAPLMKNKGEISFISSKDLCDYNNILISEPDISIIQSLIQDIFKDSEIKKIFLESIPGDSQLFDYFNNLRNELKIEIMNEDVSPFLVLPNSWEEYLSSLRKKHRHELRRKIRRLEETVEFTSGDIYDSDEIYNNLDEFIYLLKISSKEKENFMNENREKFFKELILNLSKENKIIYSYLKVENKTVSSSISFYLNDTRYLYNSGFDPKYNYLSVGLLNHAFAIQRSISKRFNIFDFMRGNERYKYELGGIDKLIYSITISK